MTVTVSESVSDSPYYLPGDRARAQWMRLDAARVLKRFHFAERALLVNMAAWLPSLALLDIKIELPRLIWQNAQTAGALRERVFELRYPNRLMEEGDDTPLLDLLAHTRNAPSPAAFLQALGDVLLPALRDACATYLDTSDPIADGPTFRFLRLGIAEKSEQIAQIQKWAEAASATESEKERMRAARWTASVRQALAAVGGISALPCPPPLALSEPPPLQESIPYIFPDRPARDTRFWPCRFYWPDIVDPAFSYGEGQRLQLRSAVSHLNEVWAIETGGIILSAFADLLPWEWIADAARWTYDESRHCRMGYDRLTAWGFAPEELPLGTYIYDSAAGQDPIYRLGMLFFFETKNIGQKPVRARRFHEYGDAVSEHDMDFDWADETIHAGYGKRWLQEILRRRGEDPEGHATIRDRCGALVAAMVASAESDETETLRAQAERLISKAAARAADAMEARP